MISNDFNLNDEYFVSTDKKFLKKYNNIYISDEQKEILDKYNIDVISYSNISELIFDIEEYLNNTYDDVDDLEWVSQTISEYNYYNNINK